MAAMEITTKIGCRINCRFCPQKLLLSKYFSDKSRPEYMSFHTFQTCIDKLPQEVMIDFAGMCEPWLNPECTKMVQYAAERGHKIRIYSTLEGMEEDDIEALAKIPIHKFVLHVPDENRNSCIEVTEKYLGVLKRLMEIDLSCPTSISCHGSMNRLVQKIVTDDWTGAEDFKANDRAGNLQIDEINHQEVRGRIYCNACGINADHNVLLPDGTVLLCCMDYGMQHVLGNLLNDNYQKILQGREADGIRKNMAGESGDILCRKCEYAIGDKELAERYIQSVEKAEEIWEAKCWLEKQYYYHKQAYEDLKDWCEELTQDKQELETMIKEKNAEVNDLKAKIGYERERMNKIMSHPVLRRIIALTHLDI